MPGARSRVLSDDAARAPVAGVIGSPIAHSRSPAIFGAAFASEGIDWHYFPFEVGEGDGAAAVEAMRTLGLRGLSVTMPLKVEVIDAVDRCSAGAEALGAVNCIAWEGDELVGHNTDGDGFVDSLRWRGIDPAGGRAVVVGAGGAARSISEALGRAGSPEVVVVNRSLERAERAAALAGTNGRVGTEADIVGAELVFNATSVGMAGTEAAGELPIDPARLHRGQVVADIVYVPLVTPLLEAASAAGALTLDGLGMLTGQAAQAFTLWTGRDAPIAIMEAAARQTLDR